jgi:flagellar motility protein MotE (MotC chaperone)
MMSWWRQHWRGLLAVTVTLIGLVVALILFVLRKRREADELRAQLALMNTSMAVAGLEADRKARRVELETNLEAAAVLDAQIAQAKRETVAVVESVKGMPDAEVAAAFKKLGY